MVWQRLRVPGNTSLATLHDALQIINGWDDFYLHQFHINGQDYAASDRAWMTNFHGANALMLEDFLFGESVILSRGPPTILCSL